MSDYIYPIVYMLTDGYVDNFRNNLIILAASVRDSMWHCGKLNFIITYRETSETCIQGHSTLITK